MNPNYDFRPGLTFVALVFLSYLLSPVYIHLAGWDVASNAPINTNLEQVKIIYATTAVALLTYSVFKSVRVCTTFTRIVVISLAILPWFVNVVYCTILWIVIFLREWTQGLAPS
jgi:hypothetical protein